MQETKEDAHVICQPGPSTLDHENFTDESTVSHVSWVFLILHFTYKSRRQFNTVNRLTPYSKHLQTFHTRVIVPHSHMLEPKVLHPCRFINKAI